MNITSWNVNSIRARLDRVVTFMDQRRPDVACFQELKCLDAEVPRAPLEALGYQVETFGQKAYNGVALLSRSPMTDVVRVQPLPDDPQARGLAATIAGIRVVCLYVPNGGELNSDKYAYKLRWLDALIELLRPEVAAQPIVVCGDYNIAPADLDIYDPRGWAGQTLVSEPERARFAQLLGLGLHDAYRLVHPSVRQFTWWDYRGAGFDRDEGLRIDHHLINAPIQARLTDVTVEIDAREGKEASDHAPVTLHLRDR